MFVLAVVAKLLTAVLGLNARHGLRTTVAGRTAMRVRDAARKMLAADIWRIVEWREVCGVGVDVVGDFEVVRESPV